MEETVRSLLQNQDTLEGPSVDPLDLMKAYKNKLLEEMWKQQNSLEGPTPPLIDRRPNSPGCSSRGHEEDSHEAKPLLERLRALEDLKEECVKLRTRVFDLEQQNRILNVLFQQRVKISSNPVSQEVQRNGKAGVPAVRWPSLLSLTCPRSSCSGSEASLSSACSEYSSGSHTWAEGRSSTKQSAINREKRMSATYCSVSVEQPDLSWKEGHILKGLKRLQMRSPAPQEPSSLASTSHFKNCMTSNEGIYSLGVKCGPIGVLPALAKGKPFKPGAGVSTLISDSDDADDESPQSPVRESCCPPIKDTHHLEGQPASELEMAQGEKSFTDYNSQEEPVRLVRSPSNSLSPIKDVFLLKGPTLKPGLSPTATPTTVSGLENTNWIEKDKQSAFTNWNVMDSCNLRPESVKQPQETVTDKQLETGAREVRQPIHHSASRALSWVSEVRQRSASMDTKHYREPNSQGEIDTKDYTILESRQRKAMPKACNSARKAFFLRSKSVDGGPDQAKLHQPLHQKLIKVNQRSNNHLNTPGSSGPGTKTYLSKAPGPAKASVQMFEKGKNATGARTSGPLENRVQSSPSSSPQKLVKVFKPPGLNDYPKRPSKVSQPVSKLTSSGAKAPNSNNSACFPLKQRQQDQHSDPPRNDIRSLSPPPPPGRTTSLLIRTDHDSLPQVHKPVVQPQTSSTVKATTNSTKSQSSHHSSILQKQAQAPIKMQDTPHMDPKMGSEMKKSPKLVPTKVHHTLPISTPIQESKETAYSHSSLSWTVAQASHQENSAPFVVPNQGCLPVSQQSNDEPQSTELLPQASASLLCHGIVSNSQHSMTRVEKSSILFGSKTNESTSKPGNNSTVNTATKGVQTFENLYQDTYTRPMMHCVNAAVAKVNARRNLKTRCSSLEEPTLPPTAAENGVTLDWGFDEEGWLFKRSVSVSTRPPIHPVMGMNGAKARSHSFGARYMDRPNVSRSGKVRTHIKTNSGSSLNSLGDVFWGSMSCSNSYHCPMNRSHVNNFMIEEGLPLPPHLRASSDRFDLKHKRLNSTSHLQTDKQLSSTFCEPIHGEPERQSTIEEKVMMGIKENLQKSQEQEKTTETKQKSVSSLANWFGFRKNKLPAPSGKNIDTQKGKEEKKEPKLGSLLGGKQAKSDKKERRKSEGHRMDSSVGKRDSQDAFLLCLSMASQGASVNSIMQGQTGICGDTKTKTQRMNLRTDNDNGAALKSPSQDHVIGSGCKMRTLDSGIGTFTLLDSSSFLHFLPKSPSARGHSLSPPTVPSSSSAEVSLFPLPRWRVPACSKDHPCSQPELVNASLSDTTVTLVQSVPYPTVAFLQPIPSLSEPLVTCTSVCDTQSRLPRLASDLPSTTLPLLVTASVVGFLLPSWLAQSRVDIGREQSVSQLPGLSPQ
nr:nck-associated protein 5-like [Oncorhynchus nerka]